MDSDAFRRHLSQSSLVQSPPSGVEGLVTLDNKTLLTRLDKHSSVGRDPPDTAWYNTDVGEAKKASRRAERRFRKSGLGVLKQLFRQAYSKCTLVVRKAQTNHVQSELMELRRTLVKCFVNKLLGKDASPPIFPDLEDRAAADLTIFLKEKIFLRAGKN